MRVVLDGRTFLVTFDEEGEVVKIMERKLYCPGRPYAAWYNRAYWYKSCHKPIGGPNTIPARIIAAAKAQRAAK